MNVHINTDLGLYDIYQEAKDLQYSFYEYNGLIFEVDDSKLFQDTFTGLTYNDLIGA